MWTLALETTSAQGSVALLRDAETVVELALAGRNYGVDVFRASEEALAGAGLKLKDIDRFAVADGPGSFTGVRVGLTVVKGWTEVLGTPAVSVSTLAAVRACAPSAVEYAALDASRGEVYFAGSGNDEGLESVAAFRARLAHATGVTPNAGLLAAIPELRLVGPLLAAAVGRLAQGAPTTSSLRLDARYLRRSDAELYA
ncbi:MAG TPA: tRNA (adenosine(37)-N6)-threonylcarbamoyltransferase complex dimerization subunit type 1 TsaB [Terriglobales bacterium]|nr:tRNA (adenosine(37)-N6)-threonylcarbamoyltransferase complex dimerization subunit type 1 TsaB [Terriglobales bacterium]